MIITVIIVISIHYTHHHIVSQKLTMIYSAYPLTIPQTALLKGQRTLLLLFSTDTLQEIISTTHMATSHMLYTHSHTKEPICKVAHLLFPLHIYPLPIGQFNFHQSNLSSIQPS